MNGTQTKCIVLIIIFLLLMFFVDPLSSEKNEHHYTNIKESYECENSTIYIHSYYQDKKKKLMQLEFIELNFSSKKSLIDMKVYNQDEEEIRTVFIKSENQENNLSHVKQTKYILQFQKDTSDFYSFLLCENNQEQYHFKIDINDFEKHTLTIKDENYFSRMSSLKNNKESEEYKNMNDTGFFEYDILYDDESVPEE